MNLCATTPSREATRHDHRARAARPALRLAAAVLVLLVSTLAAATAAPAKSAGATVRGTLGRSTIGASTHTGGAGFVDLSGPYTLDQPSDLGTLTGYIAGGSADQLMRAVVYADNGNNRPGAFVHASFEVKIPAGAAPAWVDFDTTCGWNYSSSPPGGYADSCWIPAGKYWLGYWYGNTKAHEYYDTVAGGGRYAAVPYSSYDDPPASFGTGYGSDNAYSLYATVGGGVAPAPDYDQISFPPEHPRPSRSRRDARRRIKALTTARGRSATPTPGSAAPDQGSNCTPIPGATELDLHCPGGRPRLDDRRRGNRQQPVRLLRAGASARQASSVSSPSSAGRFRRFGRCGRKRVHRRLRPVHVRLDAGRGGRQADRPPRRRRRGDDDPGGDLHRQRRPARYVRGRLPAGDASAGPGVKQLIEFTFPSPPTLAPGRYWLGYWFGSTAKVAHDTVAAAGRYVAASYSASGNPPARFGTGTGTGTALSLYATFGGVAPIQNPQASFSIVDPRSELTYPDWLPQRYTVGSRLEKWTGGPPGLWTEADSVADQWRRCDAQGNHCADIAGATGETYVLQEADLWGTVRLVETATNAFGTATAVTTQTPLVQWVGHPQSSGDNYFPPTISGEAVEGQTLTAHPGAWDGYQPISFAYQWQRCDTVGSDCVDIPDLAPGETYVLTAGDVGHTIAVLVTATNASGSGTFGAHLSDGQFWEPPIVVAPAANKFGRGTVGASAAGGGSGFIAVSGPYTLAAAALDEHADRLPARAAPRRADPGGDLHRQRRARRAGSSPSPSR